MPGLQSTLHSLGPWFHNLHLPDGTQTAPGPSARRFSRVQVADDCAASAGGPDGPARVPPPFQRTCRLHERDRLLDAGWPKLALIEHCLEDDSTNWWLANDAAVRALLRMSGFAVTAMPDYELYLCH